MNKEAREDLDRDLEYLRKEFKKSEDKFREAEREGYETNADIWQNDMVNIGHQIHIHEKASKADEYEAKARAFDEIIEILKELRDFSKQTEPHSQRMKEKRRNYVQFCDEVLREIELTYKEIIEEYESGEME